MHTYVFRFSFFANFISLGYKVNFVHKLAEDDGELIFYIIQNFNVDGYGFNLKIK